ncbi:MAG: methyl-accepting chemotaxis protein [Deltaproteobacteria bacterium]|nr:methyl-accepting chemotaxis protein [Deltaproteobacteria bacterium]
MTTKPPFRRRNYFIKKKFQFDFAVKFLILIAIEAVLAIGLFLYVSKGTLTAGYSGPELTVARTYDFFLPILLFSNLIIVGATAVAGLVVLIFLSHRIAGPLYRFENILNDLSKGDLTRRFKLRETDQLLELEKGINEMANTLDRNVGDIKSAAAALTQLASEMQTAAASNPSASKSLERLLQEISRTLRELKGSADFFKTSL